LSIDRHVITGGGRMRRSLSRALLVVGGAVGLTAAAWALSAATASAGTLGDHLPVTAPVSTTVTTRAHSPETASADAGVHEMARAVETVSKPAVGSLGDQHQSLAGGAGLPDSADFDRFAHQVRDDFGRVGQHVATPAPSALVADSVSLVHHVVRLSLAKLPAQLPIPGLGDGSSATSSADGRQTSPTSGVKPGDATSAASSTPAGDTHAVTAVNVRHPLPPYKSSDHSGPRNTSPVPPAPVQIPLAPCCFGHGGTGSAGGSNSSWQLPSGSFLGAAAIQALRATSQSVSVFTGRQAGITPD
jgi:hypothetical protein